jgi:lipopolysaccharide export system ATP-binding protein
VARLVANKISKTIKGRKIVDHISFFIESGEIVGLLGPNGAGKTTSFYMVVGLISPDQVGEQSGIFLDQENLTYEPMYRRARRGLSYLPQEPSIFKKLTVEENILLALENAELTSQQKEKKLEELLQDFNIQHIRKSLGISLSGGERRRVEIARSLAQSPKFILLDEPFAGIDPIAVHDIQGILYKLTERGIGILITDHNVRETLRICSRAYILKEGKIQVFGTGREIADNELAKKFYLGENFKL